MRWRGEQVVSLIVILFDTEIESHECTGQDLKTDAVHSVENIMRVETR